MPTLRRGPETEPKINQSTTVRIKRGVRPRGGADSLDPRAALSEIRRFARESYEAIDRADEAGVRLIALQLADLVMEITDEDHDEEDHDEVRIIRRNEVRDLTGLSDSSIVRLERRGEFPPRRRLGPKAVGYLLSEVEDWIATRPVADSHALAPATDSVEDAEPPMSSQERRTRLARLLAKAALRSARDDSRNEGPAATTGSAHTDEDEPPMTRVRVVRVTDVEALVRKVLDLHDHAIRLRDAEIKRLMDKLAVANID